MARLQAWCAAVVVLLALLSQTVSVAPPHHGRMPRRPPMQPRARPQPRPRAHRRRTNPSVPPRVTQMVPSPFPEWEDATWERMPIGFDSRSLTVKWMAPFYSGGGYSSEATAIALALDNEFPLAIEQHGDPTDYMYMNGMPLDVRQQLSAMQSRTGHTTTTIQVCHSDPDAWQPKPERYSNPCPSISPPIYKIGRTHSETDRLPKAWLRKLSMMDEIWVPSRFHRALFIDKGLPGGRILVVPQPAPVEEFNPEELEPLQLEASTTESGERRFAFLSIFKWEHRKGWDLLLRAYMTEFTIDDPVVLYVLTDKFATTSALMEHLYSMLPPRLERSSLPRVVALPKMAQKDMPRVYKSVDAFVLPSRGEGWSRTVTEAMCMELPVIATMWGGMTEYLTEDNSFPVQVDGMAPVPEGPFKGHNMGEPSIVHLRQRMQQVYENQNQALKIGRRARQDMVSQYHPRRVAKFISRHMARIAEALQPSGQDEL